MQLPTKRDARDDTLCAPKDAPASSEAMDKPIDAIATPQCHAGIGAVKCQCPSCQVSVLISIFSHARNPRAHDL